MNEIILFFVALAAFLAVFFLVTLDYSLREMGFAKGRSQMQRTGILFFYRSLHLAFFPRGDYDDGLFFALSCGRSLFRFFFSGISFYLLARGLIFDFPQEDGGMWFWLFLFSLLIALSSFVINEYLPRLLARWLPSVMIQLTALPASCALTLLFPFTYLFLKFFHALSLTIYGESVDPMADESKQELIDLIEESEIGESSMTIEERRLISSIVTFRDKIVREVMVPRIDVFCLPSITPLQEAAIAIENEGYSRVPLYEENVDHVVGILMYKDILSRYELYARTGEASLLQQPVFTVQKPVVYAPETQKISHLLQEFRKKQVHFAVVVDEYGGTAGIITIEDILEEIVGNIADEYDEAEEALFTACEGGWLVDARMTILELKEQLSIEIPEEGDYDTIGGHIYHFAGAIPQAGFTIHHDQCTIEVVASNDRCVEQVRILPAPRDEVSDSDDG